MHMRDCFYCKGCTITLSITNMFYKKEFMVSVNTTAGNFFQSRQFRLHLELKLRLKIHLSTDRNHIVDFLCFRIWDGKMYPSIIFNGRTYSFDSKIFLHFMRLQSDFHITGNIILNNF